MKYPRWLEDKMHILKPDEHIQHIWVCLIKVRSDNSMFYLFFIFINCFKEFRAGTCPC